VTATLETLPSGRTHWSSRGMAKASGLAPSTVQRIWKAFSLQPHRSETFKLSQAAEIRSLTSASVIRCWRRRTG
jgi:hypothetical protein